MDPSEREILLLELRRFSSIRSLEIAKSNIDRLDLILKSEQKGIQIRELQRQNMGYYMNSNSFSKPMHHNASPMTNFNA